MLTNQKRTTAPCPTCPTGRIYTGANRQYNAKSRAGTEICAGCKADEVLDTLYSKYPQK